jgi:ATPase subunit of ABC transporter with duplicated ATPase domains
MRPRSESQPKLAAVGFSFGGGNRYGLIGANGCGKSTFMKILGGELEAARTVRKG